MHFSRSPSTDTALRPLVWLWPFLRPQLSRAGGLLGLSLLASALVLLQPWMTKLLIDEGLLASDYPRLVLIAGTMIGIGLLGTVLSGINRYLHTCLSGSVLFALRENLYAHLQTLSPTFYAQRRTGDIMSRLDGDVAEIQRFAVDSLFSAVTNTLGLVGAVVLMLSLSWELSLGVLLLIPLQALYLRVMRRRVETATRRLRERAADLSAFLVETLTAVKFIQSVAAEQRENHRLRGLGRDYLDDLLRLQITEFFTSAVPASMASLARAGVFLLGGYWVIQGSWQLGSLIAFSTYLGMALGPVQGLLGLYVAIRRMGVSLERVMALRRQVPTVRSPPDPQPLPRPLRGEIILQGVSFCYPERDQDVLSNTDARFPAGSKIALGGDSGVGKSTLIDLLLRYYDPREGRIFLDGIDLRTLDLGELRRSVALVSQDLVLFRASLADNIRYARPDATTDQVRAVAHSAQLGELIDNLPQGLDTPLGERGAQLSGGQRQRVAIARALLQDPAILILDEATSAVDEATEAQVIAAVDQLFADRTRIVVSHRSTALSGADLAYKLRQGQLHRQVGALHG